MSKRWNRMETWVGLMVLAVGGVLLFVGGLWVYMSATSTPLHPNAQGVPSETRSTPPPKWIGAVDNGRQRVRTHLSEKNLPGVSVAVGIKGDIVWAEGFGWSDIDKRVPVAPDTRFRVGTASTVLTSAAVGLLLEKGAINLDTEIQTYVPEFPRKQWPVTVRQLMAHVAGVGTDGGDEGPLFGEHCDRPVDALHVFAERELRSEPGTQYRYSSYGWILVSAAIEAAAREPFLIFMRKQIFGPLGMNDTIADSTSEPAPNRTTPYFPRFAADPRYGADVTRDIDLSCYAGAGVFLSTPSDLVRFAMAVNNGTLLQPATVQLLQAPQRLRSGAETGYGLGWDLETVTIQGKETPTAGHDGDVLGGMVASLLTVRDRGIVVAVTSNISYADTFTLASKIADAFAVDQN